MIVPYHSHLVSICKAEHLGLIQAWCSIQICSIWSAPTSKCVLSKIGECDLAWNWNDVISLLMAYLFSMFWGWKSQYIGGKGSHCSKSGITFQEPLWQKVINCTIVMWVNSVPGKGEWNCLSWFLIYHSHPLSLGTLPTQTKLEWVSSHRKGGWLLDGPLSVSATRYLFPSMLLGNCVLCRGNWGW